MTIQGVKMQLHHTRDPFQNSNFFFRINTNVAYISDIVHIRSNYPQKLFKTTGKTKCVFQGR